MFCSTEMSISSSRAIDPPSALSGSGLCSAAPSASRRASRCSLISSRIAVRRTRSSSSLPASRCNVDGARWRPIAPSDSGEHGSTDGTQLGVHTPRRREMSSAFPPRMRTILVRDVSPLRSVARPPVVRCRRSRTARFALPPSGGAATRTRIVSPWSPLISLREAPGTTSSRMVAPSGCGAMGFTASTYPLRRRTRRQRHPADTLRSAMTGTCPRWSRGDSDPEMVRVRATHRETSPPSCEKIPADRG